MEKIIDIVKNNTAKILYVKLGIIHYKIETDKFSYVFSVDTTDTEDVGTAQFDA